MAEYRLRIGFAKTGPVAWLSHLELVRALERCVRRSGLDYAISQGFNPHMKHSFSAALPVGAASLGEFMDVELAGYTPPEEALARLKAAQHELLPVHSAAYVLKDEPSLQVSHNLATYLLAFDNAGNDLVPTLLGRLESSTQIELLKKGKPKTYELAQYVCGFKAGSVPDTLELSLLSRPEGSLRPESLLAALAAPDFEPRLKGMVRIALECREL